MRAGKKILIVVGALLVLLGVGSLFLKPVLESSLEKYLRDKLVIQNQASPLSFEFESLDLNLLGRKLNLHGLRIYPSPADPAASEAPPQAFRGLEVSRITLHGIAPSHFLWNKDLDISSLTLDTVKVLLRKTASRKPKDYPPPPGTGGSMIDSIRLPGLSDVRLGVFEMDHFQLLVEREEQDTLAQFTGNQLSLKGIRLSQAGDADDAPFVPVLDSLELELHLQRSELGGGAYALSYDRFYYGHARKSLQIDNLTVEALLEPSEMKSRHDFSYETYGIALKDLKIEGLELESLFRGGELRMRSLTLDSVQAAIFRDKTLPYNTGKTVPLPTQSLSGLKFPLRIDTLRLRNGTLKYAETIPDSDELLTVELDDLQIALYPVVSGAVAGSEADTLHIDLSTHVLNAIPIEVAVRMPYGRDALHVTGHSSGSARLHTLNRTVYPAIGMKFTGGNLTGLHFRAAGNYRHIQGELTMLYNDMEVEFLKEEGDRSKTKSMLANTAVRKSNPNRNGKTIVGVIEFDRVPYKGLGNYLWKTVQSGLVNSMNPVGKHHKEKGRR